jgi:hypothetical protein
VKKLTIDDKGDAYMTRLIPALEIPIKVSCMLLPWIARSDIAITDKGKAILNMATIYAVLI